MPLLLTAVVCYGQYLSLHLTCFAAIKSYVAAGMIFPQTAENFTKLHPESELKKLTELDPLIYEVDISPPGPFYTPMIGWNWKLRCLVAS